MATLDSSLAMGVDITAESEECLIYGSGGNLKTPDDVLDVRNSGTTLRFFSSAASLAPGYTVLTGDQSIRTRPMQDLMESLEKLGVSIRSTKTTESTNHS